VGCSPVGKVLNDGRNMMRPETKLNRSRDGGQFKRRASCDGAGDNIGMAGGALPRAGRR
jgi:hypothetical protein